MCGRLELGLRLGLGLGLCLSPGFRLGLNLGLGLRLGLSLDPRLGLLVRCPGCLFLALLLFGGKVCCSDMAIEPGALTAPLGIAAPTNFGAVVLDKLLVNDPSSGATA